MAEVVIEIPIIGTTPLKPEERRPKSTGEWHRRSIATLRMLSQMPGHYWHEVACVMLREFETTLRQQRRIDALEFERYQARLRKRRKAYARRKSA